MNSASRIAVAFAALATFAASLCHAETSVTIRGQLMLSVDNVHLGNFQRAGHRSESRVTDDRSYIIFGLREDLGSDLSALAQVEWILIPDLGGDATSGTNYVGLSSSTWGRLLVGRFNLHFFHRESEWLVRNTLKADSISLLAYAARGAVPIAAATRTANVTRYTTPNWNGFTLDAAYSTNPGYSVATLTNAPEADIGSGTRKGYGWNLNPNYEHENYQVGYSYWTAKNDGVATTVATGDQRGDRLYGSFRWSGFMLGLALDKSMIRVGTGAATGTTLSNRKAFSIPFRYRTGRHTFIGHYTKAADDKATPGVQDGARMWSIGYAYDFSKRTSLGVSWSKISNDAGAAYQPYGGALVTHGNPASAAAAGEDPRTVSLTMRLTF